MTLKELQQLVKNNEIELADITENEIIFYNKNKNNFVVISAYNIDDADITEKARDDEALKYLFEEIDNETKTFEILFRKDGVRDRYILTDFKTKEDAIDFVKKEEGDNIKIIAVKEIKKALKEFCKDSILKEEVKDENDIITFTDEEREEVVNELNNLFFELGVQCEAEIFDEDDKKLIKVIYNGPADEHNELNKILFGFFREKGINVEVVERACNDDELISMEEGDGFYCAEHIISKAPEMKIDIKELVVSDDIDEKEIEDKILNDSDIEEFIKYYI